MLLCDIWRYVSERFISSLKAVVVECNQGPTSLEHPCQLYFVPVDLRHTSSGDRYWRCVTLSALFHRHSEIIVGQASGSGSGFMIVVRPWARPMHCGKLNCVPFLCWFNSIQKFYSGLSKNITARIRFSIDHWGTDVVNVSLVGLTTHCLQVRG